MPDSEKTASLRLRAERALSAWRKQRRLRAAKKKRLGNRRLALILTTALLLLLGTFAASMLYLFGDRPGGRQLSFDEITTLASQGRVASATVRNEDNVVVGRFTPLPEDRAAGKPVPVSARAAADSPVRDITSSGAYWLAYPSNGQLLTALNTAFANSEARVEVDRQPAKQRAKTVTTFLLPLMILANLFALIFSLSKGGGSGIGDVMTFGTIGKGQAGKRASALTFADVGGAEEAVAELREVRDYLVDPAKYEALGASPPKGVLLFGPPGTGKTLLAKAVAGEAGVPFFSVAGAEFVESLVGVGAARVRDLFARVRANAPAIVFIDELDAAGRKRGSGGGGGGSDEREQTLNQLPVEMDGFEVSSGIVVMGATNRPDILDPALMRPGRFDRHITIERPEYDGRVHILQIHAKGKPLGEDVDLELVAKRTPGFTGADLANVVNEATLLAIRDQRQSVTSEDLDEAVQRVLNGPKRRGRVMTEDERLRTAYHEAGHVIVAAAAGGVDELHRVSILSRGRAAATTSLTADTEDALLTESQLTGKLATVLAGIATEALVFGEMSTGGEQDLEQATGLALDIVARFGMSERLGTVRLLAASSEGFLGGETPLATMSVPTQSALDEEVRRLVSEARAQATALLTRHRATLDAIAATLLEQETIEGVALQQVIAPVRAEMSGELTSVRQRSNGARPRRPAKRPAPTPAR
ncbi:MAG TPA: ATP-dependent zinc metalloprotease FtsH [Mycobacteriales bacterium]|nr:ATP-dependent zinc metalloprotease FtsH [Mycobacteriales bacterium]